MNVETLTREQEIQNNLNQAEKILAKIEQGQLISFQEYMALQMAEMLGSENKAEAKKELNLDHEPTNDEAITYYIESGKTQEFAQKYAQYRQDLQEN
jgi:hypothetical protein